MSKRSCLQFTQIALLDAPRQDSVIASQLRDKALRLVLQRLERTIADAPYFTAQLKQAIQDCQAKAERTLERDEAEIIEALRAGWATITDIVKHTPSKVTYPQANKILHELEALKIVSKGHLRDERHMGHGGNRYNTIWTLLSK
jgi:CRP-like cAMP-binding protein